MATAKKLPSGAYRVRVYDKHTQKYKSFTAPTKREAERLANDYLDGLTSRISPTLETAATEYINARAAVLSPTTISCYKVILKNNMTRLLNRPINEITPQEVQDWVNELTVQKTPKTVKNAYGFFTAVINYNDVDIKLKKIVLPKKTKQFKRLPTVSEVIDAIADTSVELPALLGVWLGMRMSEIRGIRKCDIDGNILTINQVVVVVDNKDVVKSAAKTYNSNRQLKLPPPIMDLIDRIDCSPTDRIIPDTRDSIYHKFKRLMLKQGFNISFHDLRHVNASVMAALNIPDLYAMERGGWSNTATLKGVYQQTFDDQRRQVDAIIDNYFTQIYATKCATKKEEVRNEAV